MLAFDHTRGGLLRLDEDALSGTFLGRFDRYVLLAYRNESDSGATLGVPLRFSEYPVSLADVGQTVVEKYEDVGCYLLTEPVAGAEILIDPNLHITDLRVPRRPSS